jgi:hypothetical protein
MPYRGIFRPEKSILSPQNQYFWEDIPFISAYVLVRPAGAGEALKATSASGSFMLKHARATTFGRYQTLIKVKQVAASIEYDRICSKTPKTNMPFLNLFLIWSAQRPHMFFLRS